MTNCPPSLRGDLSKWLCEINTGVYVGNVSSRVRDAIWDRVCENLKNGQATLVFNTNNEQRMDFRTHNTSWEAVDFEGIKLMRRPLPQTQAPAADLKPGFSNAAKRQMAQKMARKKAAAPAKEESYTVIDLETTGLNAASDAIVEYGALRVRDGQPAEEFSALVRGTEPLPDVVAKLTGITPEERSGGMEPLAALEAFLAFVGKDTLVGYHLKFDLDFLRAACIRNDRPLLTNRSIDVLPLARRKVSGVMNYKLLTLARETLRRFKCSAEMNSASAKVPPAAKRLYCANAPSCCAELQCPHLFCQHKL